MDFNRILSSLSGADGKNQFSKHIMSLAVRDSLSSLLCPGSAQEMSSKVSALLLFAYWQLRDTKTKTITATQDSLKRKAYFW